MAEALQRWGAGKGMATMRHEWRSDTVPDVRRNRAFRRETRPGGQRIQGGIRVGNFANGRESGANMRGG